MIYTENIVKNQAYRVNTGVDSYDKISLWTHAEDVEMQDGVELADKFKFISGVLRAGSTTVTLRDDVITSDGHIEIYVPSEFIKVTPDEIIEQVDGSITIAFPVQTADMPVQIRCIKERGIFFWKGGNYAKNNEL